MNTRNILSGARVCATIIILSGWLSFVGADAALGGGLGQPRGQDDSISFVLARGGPVGNEPQIQADPHQPVIPNQPILPPYGTSDGSKTTVLGAEAEWYAPYQDPNGTFGVMAKAFSLGSANAWAGHGFYYTSPVDQYVTIEFDMKYYPIDFGFGLGTTVRTISSLLWVDDSQEEDFLSGGVDIGIPGDDFIANAKEFSKTFIELLIHYLELNPEYHTMQRNFHLSAGDTVRILCGCGARVSAAGGCTSAARLIGQITRIEVIPRPTATYNVIDLGTLGGYVSEAFSINCFGDIVGVADTPSYYRATLFDATGKGRNVDLWVLPGAWRSRAFSINDLGQIVGDTAVFDQGHAVGCATWFDATGNGYNIDLGTLPGGSSSFAVSLNFAGQIVGYVWNSQGDWRATLFDPTGVGYNIDLGTLGGDESWANSINFAGQIVGDAENSQGFTRATLFDPTGAGNNIDLGTLPGGYESWALSINDAGQIVGWAYDNQFRMRATLFDPTGAGNNIDLGTLGGSSSGARFINNNGKIIGWATNSGGDSCATLFDPTGAGGNIDLNKLIDPGIGWSLDNATCINNSGCIVGSGINPQGRRHAFLLQPAGNQTQPPNTPSTPIGQTSGYVGRSYTYYTSTTDPDNDMVQYTFNLDGRIKTTGLVNSGENGSVSRSWSVPGTYSVKAMATDSKGAQSGWSPPLTVNIQDHSRPPNSPSRPSGVTSGNVGISYTYSTSTTDPDGDQVKYTFDWGDGWFSTTGSVDSGRAVNASHSWVAAGTYLVKVIATDEHGAPSGWSDALTVNIIIATGPGPDLIVESMIQSPGTPPPQVGDPYVYFDIVIKNQGQARANLKNMKLSLYKSNLSNLVGELMWPPSNTEYVDPNQALTVQAVTMQNSYLTQTAGTFTVITFVDSGNVIAESNEGNNQLSKQITIIATNRPPNTPSIPSGPTSGTVGTSYTYSTSATDPDGDQVKYTFDWGDGSPQPTTGLVNSGTALSAAHSWAVAGTYLVKANATDSKGAVSGWSDALIVNVSAAVGQILVDVPGLGGIRKGPSANVLTIYSSGQYIEWTSWYGNTYQQGEVAINATCNVTIPHYASFILSISRPAVGKTAWLFGRENDGQLAYTTLTGTTQANTLVDVAGFGGIRKGPSPNLLTIYSSGQVVEWTLWYGSTYQTDYIAAGNTRNVTVPHYASFILTIARPGAGKTSWLFARENDSQLAYTTLTGTTTATTLVNVPGFGGIRRGPSANVLTIYSSGQYIEWTLWYGNTYQQGGVAANATGNVTIPHYASFILSISRPAVGKTAWLFARENDNQLAYAVIKSP